ncbi:MAG: DnaD domain protein [Lachnospiraceae bacterium]|jgi:DnaD/phage-associated family protein|nr:DnaD domain protein [Lachnospiraceae bacterium]
MGRLKIYKDNYTEATAVSNIFIDEYMKDANDAQLKVYLYLIRMMNANLPTSVSDIADKFNHTEKDVLRALKYWEKNRLLSLEYDESKSLIGIHLLDLNKTTGAADGKPFTPVVTLMAASLPQEAATVPRTELAAENPYEKPSYTLDQLKKFKSNEETSQLLFIVEQYIGKTLSPSEIKTVFFIQDKLGFSMDLTDYLVQYCVERGKKDFRYIEKVAISWAQASVTTPKEAEKYAYKYDRTVYNIMNALGKTSMPTKKEVEYINRWTKDFGYEMDVIDAACERTVLSTDKHRFEYADRILSGWYQANVHHKSDIAKADELFRRSRAVPQPKAASSNKFNQFKQNSYDFDALEKELLSN